MSISRPNRAALAAGILVAFAHIPADAQTPPPLAEAGTGADIVLTPGRSAQSIARSGSAVTIIRGEELEKASPASTADIFRQVPGVSVTENGGAGQAATIRLRGAEARHTLVLIDGIRVNDPSTGANEFDLASLVASDIERIEVLRGPQSALYGSDAIGGVVNVITRKGRGGYRGMAEIQGGSYGTIAGKAAVSGGGQTYDYAISIAGAQADGFSSYGYRIPRITRLLASPLENDSYKRIGGSAKFSWRPVEGVEIETGVTSSFNRARYDAAFGAQPDTPSMATGRLTTGYLKATADLMDGRFRNSVTLFGNMSDRNYNDVSFFNFGFGLTRSQDIYDYLGKRAGVEYQGEVKLDAYGKLIFGARYEDESLTVKTRPIQNSFNTPDLFTARQATRSAFALYQLPVGERLDLSFGARLDDIENGDRFATWRITGAYRFTEFGTKVRASVGTGAKAPSLFQTFSPQYGTRGLESERSLGFDVGVDQALFNGRLNLSLTAFHNKLSNLIDFSPYSLASFTYPACPVGQAFTGCYLNVAKAQTTGFEAAADAALIEGVLTARASYTNLNARDLTTGLRLARRPEHEGRVALRWAPIDKLTIEPSVALVGSRYSSANEVRKLKPYARFDMRADYQVHKNLNVFVRAENLTNVRYEEVFGYGTTGRAGYAGVRATW